MSKLPGGAMASRPLHFIWIVDCSGSMNQNGKIQTLNMAIRGAIPHMQETAAREPNAQMLVRAVKFSTKAQWEVGTPTEVANFQWNDLIADGETAMGHALELVAEEMKVPPMSTRAMPPVLVLISDGMPTDDFNAGMRVLLSQPWGQKAVRVSIGIGQDADYNVLQKFMSNSEMRPLQANNPEALVRYIRWVSTVLVESASRPRDQAAQQQPASDPSGLIWTPPPVPVNPQPVDDGVVW
jgi:uncharacterized protein YegL